MRWRRPARRYPGDDPRSPLWDPDAGKSFMSGMAVSCPCGQVRDAGRRRAPARRTPVGFRPFDASLCGAAPDSGDMQAAGILVLSKGAIGPALAAWAGHPALAAVAGGVAVAGHNWSPFLRGAGGRGISPALGALLVVAWPGAVLLLAGMILGKLFGETALGALVAEVALTPVLAVIYGAVGALAGASIAIPMLVKCVVGNTPPAPPRGHTYLTRLLYDRDERVATDAS